MVRRSTALTITALTLTAITLCLCFPLTSAASSLTVEVRNQYTNVPIPGASVTITGPENHTAITRANGEVTFSNIASGNYSLIASWPDYPSSTAINVEVKGTVTSIVLFSFTKAHFFYSPEYPLINGTVSFNATSSTSSANITRYDWTFGDGATGTGVTPTHTYLRAGNFTVQLTVTSVVGTATYTQIVQVGSPSENNLFPWILLVVPFLFIIPLILFWRRRRYYVVIQARVPVYPKQAHCPGDNTKCEDCKMTPC